LLCEKLGNQTDYSSENKIKDRLYVFLTLHSYSQYCVNTTTVDTNTEQSDLHMCTFKIWTFYL